MSPNLTRLNFLKLLKWYFKIFLVGARVRYFLRCLEASDFTLSKMSERKKSERVIFYLLPALAVCRSF